MAMKRCSFSASGAVKLTAVSCQLTPQEAGSIEKRVREIFPCIAFTWSHDAKTAPVATRVLRIAGELRQFSTDFHLSFGSASIQISLTKGLRALDCALEIANTINASAAGVKASATSYGPDRYHALVLLDRDITDFRMSPPVSSLEVATAEARQDDPLSSLSCAILHPLYGSTNKDVVDLFIVPQAGVTGSNANGVAATDLHGCLGYEAISHSGVVSKEALFAGSKATNLVAHEVGHILLNCDHCGEGNLMHEEYKGDTLSAYQWKMIGWQNGVGRPSPHLLQFASTTSPASKYRCGVRTGFVDYHLREISAASRLLLAVARWANQSRRRVIEDGHRAELDLLRSVALRGAPEGARTAVLAYYSKARHDKAVELVREVLAQRTELPIRSAGTAVERAQYLREHWRSQPALLFLEFRRSLDPYLRRFDAADFIGAKHPASLSAIQIWESLKPKKRRDIVRDIKAVEPALLEWLTLLNCP